ncbi:MAG: RNA 2',3'-cyclic phosphodiesterase [Candidatus Bathyarchaeota archaeon]|nr:RNA 2',3'-cyclic phosphodiesterase [Candidatus Bathyarchaeota archaeon]
MKDRFPLETIRSFIAFDIEEEAVLRNLSSAQSMLVETGASLRLVKPENIHVTVRFLGNISASLVDQVHEEMEKIDFAPFKVEMRGLGVFPNLRHIKVIWAGIGRGATELEEIFHQLEPRLQRLGFKRDVKGFSPHLTIARVKTGRNKIELASRLKELECFEFGLVKAECLRLKRSILTPQGPIYSVLRETCRKT